MPWKPVYDDKRRTRKPEPKGPQPSQAKPWEVPSDEVVDVPHFGHEYGVVVPLAKGGEVLRAWVGNDADEPPTVDAVCRLLAKVRDVLDKLTARGWVITGVAGVVAYRFDGTGWQAGADTTRKAREFIAEEFGLEAT